MPHDYGGPGNDFWPIAPITIWHQAFMGIFYNLDSQGLKVMYVQIKHWDILSVFKHLSIQIMP